MTHPTPWTASPQDDDFSVIRDADGRIVQPYVRPAVARQIVEAVNARALLPERFADIVASMPLQWRQDADH